MTTLILAASLFVSQISFAQVPADVICRTQHMGADQRQISVYLFRNTPDIRATISTTSTSGFFSPIYLRNLSAYGSSSIIVYSNQVDSGMGMPRFQFALTISRGYKGKLQMNQRVYDVSCLMARDPIITL